jgi:hypothetical protein
LSRTCESPTTLSRGFSGSWTIPIGDGVDAGKALSGALTGVSMTTGRLFAALGTRTNS